MADAAPIVMVCTSDLAGQTRGKGAPAGRLASILSDGVAWTPTNSMITAFGVIAPGPWGPFGDVIMAPDPDSRFDVVIGGETVETTLMADIETPDGALWPVCPRGFAKRMLAALEDRHGLKLNVAFEHEFTFEDGQPPAENGSYALLDVRRRRRFAEAYLAALDAAGASAEAFMAEFGPNQYEIVTPPAIGIAGADRAVAVREVARAVAFDQDARTSFTPLVDPDGVGNGVHIHFSLADAATGAPANYDPDGPCELDARAASFLAGVLAKLPAILALTAPSVISYLRLQPNRWSATHANLGLQDREAAVRICPTFDRRAKSRADQFHFELRAADGAASPYLALGALVAAGLHGLDHGLPAPRPLEGAPSDHSTEKLTAAGVAPLPSSLAEALDRLEADADVTAALGPDLIGAYLAHKRFEIDLLGELEPRELCRRYLEVY